MPFIVEYINSIWVSFLAFIIHFLQPLLPTFIGALILFFILFYCIPASFLFFKLGILQKNLKVFKQDNLLEYPIKLFKKRGKLFNHLWTEYEQTLHEQRKFNPQTGVEELIAIRSTTPAEMFFNPSVLVDSQLNIEFFKHLPGILTGLGIIGTFLGLIHGLQAFRIDENTEIVRQSLDQLLHGVYEAFLVSMAAIALAMFVTVIEKFLFAKLYGKVEDLCFLIDSFYESGAGEEYLERLVKSSEDSASQAKIIKDALVDELRQILREVSQQQIQSALTSQQQLGDQFKESIQAGISQPLQKIADGFNDQREHTGRDLSTALNDVFSAFTQRLQDLFGGQTTGIYDLQQKTVEALQATVKQFQQMATSIDATGRNTTNAMTETLAQTMKAMESRQQAINERMMEFMGQLRTVSQSNQAESGQKLQKLLGDLGQQMTKMVAELQTQSRSANDDHQGRQQQMADATIAAITRLSSGVETSLQTMQGQLTGMLTHLEKQTQSTAVQNTEQQRQLAEQNQQAIQALTSGVDRTVNQVSTQTADMLAKLAGTVESQQSTIADVVTKMVAELQAQSRSANDDHQGRQQRMADATIAAITRLSSGVETSLQTMQGQLTGMLAHLEQQTQSTAVQNTEQQRQLAEQNQQAIQALTSGVDRTVNQVSTQTADMLAKLAGTVESQQSTIADVVTKMVAELQAQSRSANDDHQGRQQQMADATIAAITRLSSGVETSLQTMQGQLTGMLTHLEKQTQSTAVQNTEQQRQLAEQNQQAIQALTTGVDRTVNQVSTQTADMLAKLAGTVESQQATIADVVTKMVAELQTQSRSANDDHQGRQQQMADATIAAITRLSSGVETSLQTMQGQLTGMLTHLEKQTQSTAEYHQEQQRQLTVHNQQAVTTLTASVNETVDKVSTETTGMLVKLTTLVEGHQLAAAEAVRSIQMAITQMSEVTTSALTGMNQGAENLILATDDFSKAGQSVAGVLHEATGVATKLSLSADAVSTATGAIESIVSDYATIRQQLNEMIQVLKSTVESAKKEASLTTDVLTRINQATDKLAAAQNQADRYLDQVSQVLEQTHQEFSSSMRNTLNEANTQFFQHLTAAISLLKGCIEELGTVVRDISVRK